MMPQGLCTPLLAAAEETQPPAAAVGQGDGEAPQAPDAAAPAGSPVPAAEPEQIAVLGALRVVVLLMLHGNSRPTHRPLLAALAQLPPPWLRVLYALISEQVSMARRNAIAFLHKRWRR